MPTSRISATARRYASAVLQVASESGDVDAWLDLLQQLARVLEMPSARVVFTSPAVPVVQKQSALEALFPRMTPHMRNFVRLLAENDRLKAVPGIAEALQEQINRQRGIITAEVTTAIPIDADLERLLAQRLGGYLKHDPERVQLRSRVDPSIIGGVVARIGDTLIDDSVRGRIERLRRTLATS